MSSKQFRRFLIEVIWFIVAAALIQMLYQLHMNGVMPTLLQLY